MEIPRLLPDQIQLKRHAKDWQTALKLAAEPLLAGGYITTEYVQNMIDSVNKLGPYIVISPGLALGHARPSSAVKKTGFSITTLDEAVKFGNKDNDPVDLIVILASINDVDHLTLLKKLVSFLNDAKNLSRLRQMDTQKEAIQVAQQINGDF
ncbi:MAG: PTS sugar transporter subunit IIA [Oenococcus sp.]|uniref:PTS sugar transporter subunit IIA n=1 Tax=Oenococcus sp. TaxID=1979414 RepID=UPI0039E9732E